MNALLSLLPLAALFLIADLPWLTYVSQTWLPMFQKVQGGNPIEFRYAAAPVVYLALAWLLQQTRSIEQAVGTGLAVYAVYDFTNLSTFTKYDPTFAVADTVWGGILFGVVRWLSIRLNLL